jgi:hypothetical protein
MATQEYYVRGINDTEARGPFSVEQLITLGETGRIDPETLYYNADTERWATIGSSETLKEAIFPQRRKLGIKPKDGVQTLNPAREEHRPITVEQMLAAAEGRTEETKDKRSLIVAQQNSVRIGMLSGFGIFLLSATALLLPQIDVVLSYDLAAIAKQPLIILGLVDLFCAVLLALGLSATYPFIRFRAAFGIGFLGLLFWVQDRPQLALCVTVGSVGMYFCTVFLSYVPVVTAALLGLAGIGGFALLLLT